METENVSLILLLRCSLYDKVSQLDVDIQLGTPCIDSSIILKSLLRGFVKLKIHALSVKGWFWCIKFLVHKKYVQET